MAFCAQAQTQYDLLLRGGHVIDPKNNIDAVMDVAISRGRVARVAANIPANQARTVADVTGLYVTPGLVDMHVHAYSENTPKFIAGDQSVYPDILSFRTGITTMVDAGTSGWRNFPDFKSRIISRASTRLFAFLNICGPGLGPDENNPDELNVAEAVRTAKENPGIIVGFKVAHWAKPDWRDVESAVEAGKQTGLPVMVDFGEIVGPRNLKTLLLEKLRPGDIYTHTYSGVRGEQTDSKVNPAMVEARKRGVIFDLGHGGGSFAWDIAVPAFEQGFFPDSISTDLHGGSMNGGMREITNVMSKVLNLGVPLADVIRMTTVNPARQIHHTEVGTLDVGAPGDVTVLALLRGDFGFVDASGARRAGDRKLTVEMTVKNGSVVWDINGRAARDWKTFPYPRRPQK
jgi:dihydroorotase